MNVLPKIFAAFILLSVPTVLNSAVLEVGKGKAFASLKEAIRRSRPNDHIVVYPGVYPEKELLIDKSLKISGRAFPVIDGQGVKDILTITAARVSISGLHFRNSGKSTSRDYAAIKVQKADGCRIVSCKFSDSFFGIHVNQSRHGLIRNNVFSGKAVSETSSGNGIHLWKCDSFRVEQNIVQGQRDGIYLEFVKHSLVIGNQCRKNIRYGLHFMFSDWDAYHHNVFTNNGAGVAVMYTNHVEMSGNTFNENWGPVSYGLLLKDINYSRITGNHFVKNTIGIQMENANKLQIAENTFRMNGWAMRMMGNCEYDSVVANNFIGNTFDVGTNSSGTGNQNLFSGNYWDKYKGYDLNRDKTGDIPYRPVSLFSMFVESVPNAVVLLRSFMISILDEIERSLPSLIPQSLQDPKPSMKKLERS